MDYEIIVIFDGQVWTAVAVQGDAEASFRYGVHIAANKVEFQRAQHGAALQQLIVLVKDDVRRSALADWKTSIGYPKRP